MFLWLCFLPVSASLSSPATGGSSKLQESSDFLSQLSNADSFKRKPRVAHQARPSPPGHTFTHPGLFSSVNQSCPCISSCVYVLFSEDRKPLVEVKIGSSFQPLESASEPCGRPLSPPPSHVRTSAAGEPKPSKPAAPPPVPKDVGVEKYSGLRLRSEPLACGRGSRWFIELWRTEVWTDAFGRCFIRKPRVSSSEMERKMADRRLIRLSQVPERLKREKLEDSDWVTFAVLVSKATPQSSSSVCCDALCYYRDPLDPWPPIVFMTQPSLCRAKPSASGSWATSTTWTCLCPFCCSVTSTRSTGRWNPARS